MNLCDDIQLGTSIATLVSLTGRGVPRPDSYQFNRFSRIETNGNGIPVGYGNSTCTLRWDTLSQKEINVFLNFLGSDTIMGIATTWQLPTGDGLGDGQLEQMSGVMHRPVDGSDKSFISGASKPVYSDVSIRITRLEAAS